MQRTNTITVVMVARTRFHVLTALLDEDAFAAREHKSKNYISSESNKSKSKYIAILFITKRSLHLYVAFPMLGQSKAKLIWEAEKAKCYVLIK